MNRRGFTLLEILVVIIMLGVLMVFGIPRLRDAFNSNSTRSARVALSTLAAKARAAAVARGCRAVIHFTSGTNGTAWVTVCSLNGATTDTLGGVEQIAARFNVTLTATRDSVSYAPSGISFDGLSTTLRVTSSSGMDSVVINQIGKVVR
jgi:prepilin-type N-terminal cleavage/methylation domain-containing protein